MQNQNVAERYADTIDPFALHAHKAEWGVFVIGQSKPIERGLNQADAEKHAELANAGGAI